MSSCNNLYLRDATVCSLLVKHPIKNLRLAVLVAVVFP